MTTGTPVSNPPSPDAQNQMAIAHYSRQAAIDGLRREGWSVQEPDHTVEYSPTPDVTLRLRQVHRVAHPDFTDGHTVMAVIAATSDRRYELLSQFGPLVSHRREYDRLAIAADLAAKRGIADFNSEEPQFLILLNRATGMIEYEPVDIEDLYDRAAILTFRLTGLAEARESETIPDREFERNSRACGRCQWLSFCHGAPTEPSEQEPSVTDEELERSMAEYAAAAAALSETRGYEKQRESARGVIKRYLQERAGTTVRVDCDGEVWTARIDVSEKPAINEKLARERLSPQQLADITAPTSRETVRINKAK